VQHLPDANSNPYYIFMTTDNTIDNINGLELSASHLIVNETAPNPQDVIQTTTCPTD
jgi:hypothetical protein